jgi:hypothetical protein
METYTVGAQSITRGVLREIGGLYASILAIGLILLLSYTLAMGDNSWLSWLQPELLLRRGVIEPWYQEPVVNVPWWSMTQEQMNHNRIVYNWTHKEGLKFLSWQMVLGLLGVALVLHKLRMWQIVEVSRLRGGKKMLVSGMPVYSGTVKIRSLGGVIYTSGISSPAGTMQEFGVYVRICW